MMGRNRNVYNYPRTKGQGAAPISLLFVLSRQIMSKALLGAGVIGGGLLLAGFPAWAAITAGAGGFLALGGMRYCKLVYKCLPAELRYKVVELKF